MRVKSFTFVHSIIKVWGDADWRWRSIILIKNMWNNKELPKLARQCVNPHVVDSLNSVNLKYTKEIWHNKIIDSCYKAEILTANQNVLMRKCIHTFPRHVANTDLKNRGYSCFDSQELANYDLFRNESASFKGEWFGSFLGYRTHDAATYYKTFNHLISPLTTVEGTTAPLVSALITARIDHWNQVLADRASYSLAHL